MKRILLTVIILGGLASLTYFTVDAISNNDTETPFFHTRYSGFGMMGSNYDCHMDDDDEAYDYEFLYMHLSTEDQALLDQMYAEKLQEYDITVMTSEELQTTIDSIHEELVTYILDNDLITYWNN